MQATTGRIPTSVDMMAQSITYFYTMKNAAAAILGMRDGLRRPPIPARLHFLRRDGAVRRVLLEPCGPHNYPPLDQATG